MTEISNGAMQYNFSKFLNAQEEDYATALSEIKAGHKTSHWIWYIFPQLQALGRSRTAQYYGIADLAEARAYLANEVLASRLKEISQALLDLPNDNARAVMGSQIDAVKLCSSMTLFSLADPTCEIFKKVLDKYFNGNLDETTLALCVEK